MFATACTQPGDVKDQSLLQAEGVADTSAPFSPNEQFAIDRFGQHVLLLRSMLGNKPERPSTSSKDELDREVRSSVTLYRQARQIANFIHPASDAKKEILPMQPVAANVKEGVSQKGDFLNALFLTISASFSWKAQYQKEQGPKELPLFTGAFGFSLIIDEYRRILTGFSGDPNCFLFNEDTDEYDIPNYVCADSAWMLQSDLLDPSTLDTVKTYSEISRFCSSSSSGARR